MWQAAQPQVPSLEVLGKIMRFAIRSGWLDERFPPNGTTELFAYVLENTSVMSKPKDAQVRLRHEVEKYERRLAREMQKIAETREKLREAKAELAAQIRRFGART
jgi:hypothetical protein